MTYKPPFSVTSQAINYIAEISALVERYAIRLEEEDGLLLRKINRIKTIRGSLAIEGNTLSTLQERKGALLPESGGVNGGVSGGVNIVSEFILNNPMSRIPTIVSGTGISKRSVERIIKKLREEGVVEFIGAPKTGGYSVVVF